MGKFSAEAEQGNVLSSCFTSQMQAKCPLHSLFSGMFSMSVLSVGGFAISYSP